MAHIGMTKEDKKREREFQAESDLRTLRQAKDIQGDKKRLGAAKIMAKKEIKALSSISKKTRKK